MVVFLAVEMHGVYGYELHLIFMLYICILSELFFLCEQIFFFNVCCLTAGRSLDGKKTDSQLPGTDSFQPLMREEAWCLLH